MLQPYQTNPRQVLPWTELLPMFLASTFLLSASVLVHGAMSPSTYVIHDTITCGPGVTEIKPTASVTVHSYECEADVATPVHFGGSDVTTSTGGKRCNVSATCPAGILIGAPARIEHCIATSPQAIQCRFTVH